VGRLQPVHGVGVEVVFADERAARARSRGRGVQLRVCGGGELQLPVRDDGGERDGDAGRLDPVRACVWARGPLGGGEAAAAEEWGVQPPAAECGFGDAV